MRLAETFDKSGSIEDATFGAGTSVDVSGYPVFSPTRVAPVVEGLSNNTPQVETVLPPTIETVAPASAATAVVSVASEPATPTPIVAPPALSAETLQTLTKTAEQTAANTPIADKATSWLKTDNNMWLAIGGVVLLALGAWFILKK